MSAISSIQAETLDILRTAIPPNSTVALLDFPNHANAGDVLIYRGELAYLNHLGCRVEYVSTLTTYDKTALDAAVPDGPILLHGGGNFGDRYPAFQLFRERVVSENPDRRIVGLPQTFEYADHDALTRTQEIYSNHPDLTLFIRNRQTATHVKDLFAANHVEYCPDTAFGVGPIDAPREADHDFVVLKRTDSESAHTASGVPKELTEKALSTDWQLAWLGEDLRWWPQSLALVVLFEIPAVRRRLYRGKQRTFDRQSTLILRGAVNVLSRGRVIITDRLHAAILGVLLGKPVVMIDNANSKLSAAFRDYLANIPDLRLVNDFHEGYEAGKVMGS